MVVGAQWGGHCSAIATYTASEKSMLARRREATLKRGDRDSA